MRRILAGTLFLLSMTAAAGAQQSNFQISPAPIAYPYFEPRRMDVKLTGTYMSMESDDAATTISGGGANGIIRYAFSELFAVDASMGFTVLGGEMPGFAMPFFYGGNFWTPVVTGKADLTGVSLPMSFNLEVQPLHTRRGSLILFGGPMMTFNSLSMVTPYYAVTGGTPAPRTAFTTDSTVLLGGVQFGAQGGINAGNFKFTPFVLMNTQSGTATVTFDSGYKNTTSYVGDTTVTIDPFTSTSIGMDVIYTPWDLSFGTMFQQMAAQGDNEGMSTTMLQLSWHFRK